jgi:hypothetical protein
LDATNMSLEPGFLAYDEEGLPSDFHLALSSPLINMGDPTLADPDGSRSDPGPYGGPNGDEWDRDRDGLPAWFWPGVWSDAPEGIDPTMYDCDDVNPFIGAEDCALR